MTRLAKLAFAFAFAGMTTLAYAEEAAMMPDDTITANVKSALAQHHPALKADHVSIMTKDGTVYLRGMVDTSNERQDIETTAQRAAGVKKVVNETTVNRGVN